MRFKSVLAFIPLLLSCSAGAPVDAGSTIDASAADAPRTGDAGPPLAIGSTEFFGFVGVDCVLNDPHDTDDRTEYVDEVSAFTNVAHVCASDDPDADLSARLARLDAAGLRGIVAMEFILFEFIDGPSRANPLRRLALRSDAEARLRRWLARNGAVLDSAHVSSLYVVDEPGWNGLPMEDFAAATAMVDAATDLPLAVVEAGDALDLLVA